MSVLNVYCLTTDSQLPWSVHSLTPMMCPKVLSAEHQEAAAPQLGN